MKIATHQFQVVVVSINMVMNKIVHKQWHPKQNKYNYFYELHCQNDNINTETSL